MNVTHCICAGALLLQCGAAVLAQEPMTPNATPNTVVPHSYTGTVPDLVPLQFQNGDVVCFVGDSITHSCKYHSYVYDYYLTRFPTRKIRFINCGISGDSAGGALRRLDWDVLPHNPNVVSLMLGMNDVNRGLYGKTNPDEQNLRSRAQALSSHQENMTKIVGVMTEKLHPKFIFVKPSPYDQTVQVQTENLFGVNEALAQCGQMAEALARQNHGGIVDFHGPMTEISLTQQKTDPKFTLIGPDRVHPGDFGQLVMAYLYLKAQQVPSVVSEFVIDGQKGRVLKNVNGEITNLKSEAGKVAFDCRENSLPFPIETSAKNALNYVPIEAELDQQRLGVNFNGAGTYRLTVDNQPVGDYSAVQLREGINLALNPQMPQFKQAQDVRTLNERRRQQEARLRSVAQVKIMLMGGKVDLADEAAINKFFSDFMEKQKANNSPQAAYFQSQFNNYTKTKPEIETINADIERMTQELWQRNQPTPHHYELTLLAP